MLYYIFFRGVTGSAARLFRAVPTALRACESGGGMYRQQWHGSTKAASSPVPVSGMQQPCCRHAVVKRL